ncbi:related to transposase [Fusarium oxysporum]|uniref:Related to transposase n=1 Tax=Fusarium oxysporum TaxID=5507 RepID=A0A2H3SW67_FUSOX|nr:related to transposase [Fusarium oxysporum]
MSQSFKESQIILALQAYQADPKLSLRCAAKIYDVSFDALNRRHHGIPARKDYIPSSRKLSNLEEEVIVQYILNLDSRGFPPRHYDIKEMANRLLTDRDALPVSKR